MTLLPIELLSNRIEGSIDPVSQVTRKKIRWLLRDEYTETLAAGNVNGTPAVPGPGTRTVVDTGSNLSLNGSQMDISGRAATSDPGIWYSSIDRVAGRLVVAKLNADHQTNRFEVGFDKNQSGIVGSVRLVFQLLALQPTLGTPTIGSYAVSTDYRVATVLRSAGAYFFIKGGAYTNWTLLWIESTASDDPVYPAIAVSVQWLTTNVYDFIRVPDALWLPTPLAYDSFTRDDGAIGSTEGSGPDGQDVQIEAWADQDTWAVSSNEAVNTPSLGAELLSNPDFDDWTGGSPDNWSVLVDNPPASEVTEVGSGNGHGGGGTGAANMYRSDASAMEMRQTVLTIGQFYRIEAVVSYRGGGSISMTLGNNIVHGLDSVGTFIAASRANATVVRLITTSTSDDVTIDSVSCKALTLSELFASVQVSTPDVFISAELDVVASGCAAGVVLNLDDPDSPQNFILAYLDRVETARCYLVKYVAGVATEVINGSVTYAAGAQLYVVKSGTSYTLYYNDTQVGTTQTVSDAGIVDNVYHGLFSTNENNQLDHFLLMPRGTSGEYSRLDRWGKDHP